MYKPDVFNERNKFVNRYLKPMLYEICPAFIDAELITPSSGLTNNVLISIADGTHKLVDVTDLPMDKLVIAVMEEVGEFFNE